MTTEDGFALVSGSFDALVDTHGARLFGLAYLILQDAAAAEDAVQETLIKAWRSGNQLRSPDRVDGWLRQVLVNACRDQLRQSRRRRKMIGALEPDQLVPDLDGRLADSDEVIGALRRLSTEHREVIVLRFFADLTAKAIAETLRIPEGTVRSRLHHALRTLRATLEAESRGAR